MDIELGIKHVDRAVAFSTDASQEEVNAAIEHALASHETLRLQDSKGRAIIVPADSLGYAIVGSATKHSVGFGTL